MKIDKFIDWVCGKGKYPFFQDESPCENIEIADKIQDEEYKNGEERMPEEYDEETDKQDDLEEKYNPQRK